MIEQLDQQNQRERRLFKSRLYKQMLDNQILMNQKYKKEQKRRDNNNGKTLAREIYLQSNGKTQNYDDMNDSFVHRLGDSRDTLQNIYLPTLEDRNRLYRGASRFIPNQDSSSRVHRRIRTQVIEADDSSYDDPIIQELIQQLQNINRCNSKIPSQRAKRLNYITKHRKAVEQTPHYSIGNRATQETSYLDKQMSKYQSNHENAEKSKIPKLFASPLQKIGQFSPMPKDIDQRIKSDRLQKPQKLSTKSKVLNRQNFLQVLRKVKMRGEGLHLKFCKRLPSLNKDQNNAIV